MSTSLDKNKNFLVKVSETRSIPTFCPVCEFVIKTSDDVLAYSEFQCCHECELKWAQARREIWARGWRPDSDDLLEFKEQRNNIRPKFDVI